jgi:hypothetical protein
MSGGLMLLALAAVWFAVFIPSWATRSNEKDSQRSRVRELKDALKSTGENGRATAKVAVQSSRLLALRSTLLTVFVASIAVLTWSVSTWTNEIITYAVAGGSVLVAFSSLAAVRAVNLRYRAKLAQGRTIRKTKRIDPSLFNPNKDANITVSENKTGWTASRVPDQLYRGSQGTLIEQNFAEVVELPTAKQPALDSQTLDEILRRRRSNG